MTALSNLLDTYRTASASEREKGTYFEELIVCYLRNEATYRDLYSDVWTYGQWAELQGLHKKDAGIDLVAQVQGTGEIHAIQCKLYAETYKLQKADIDSFFTASGKKPFAHRIIVSTTNHWSEHAEDALSNQQPPVSKIDLNDLESSQIDWSKYQPKAAAVLKEQKQLRPHQEVALEKTVSGLATAERGKLIMACGTGKTFTSLKIAEKIAGKGKRVLFLVPSLSLLSQTLTEWTQESTTPLHSFAVCSDSDVGKKRDKEDDAVQTFTHELRYPATTQPSKLASEMVKRHDEEHMSVVFSTYHSIDVISKAQKNHELGDFDLIICDEAHRTTGATFGDDDESNFVKVHDKEFINAKRRLYMTATPRIYSDQAEAKAEVENATLYGMNKSEWYGEDLHVITFSEAVSRGLLVDYKVIVLAVEETHVNRRLQNLLADENNQLKVDDAAKIVGCWKALAKQGLQTDLNGDHEAMKRAVAFCQVIEVSKGAKSHKVSSKNIANMFQSVVEAYQETEDDEDASKLACEAAHVDGGMNASEKEAKLTWLKAETPDNTCRILSNVRCLSEGVDVPALDAVLFLTPRNSQVDVVQSVGRVMRNSPGKKLGYVILPVVIPHGIEPHEALNDNKTYAVVWQVLQALRSHDDRFDAMVNKLDLIGKDTTKMEVIAITDKIQRKKSASDREGGAKPKTTGKGTFGLGQHTDKKSSEEVQTELQFEIGEIEKAIYAKLVKKVGNPNHWENWADDIAKIARTHIGRITDIVKNPANVDERKAFNSFSKELRDDLNNSITDGEIIEMLAQHLITKPVFDALFSDYSFAQHNPMSKAMQGVLEALQEHHLDKEADTLQKFYDSVKMRAEGIDNAAGKQKIVVELYNKFFSNAFPKMRDRLGIVYTPVEVVDFIIHSVNHILKTEFSQTLGSDGVHIIDPFTGTGTFITRLLQSGLITPAQISKKYKSEIHANEIVLLAYYIAAINIEAVYHGIVGGDYVPFEGICLTDTFQMYEKDDLVNALLVDNSARRKRQKKLDIRVILGNPPYSSGQASGNDNNPNIEYLGLDERIRTTYAAKSKITMVRSLYDSYIRSIRWASDRVGASGVVGFVTNAGFLDARSTDGLRLSLAEEFSSIYVFHLRGLRGLKTSGERAKQEGGQIFGSGSGAAISINIFVKNPKSKTNGQVFFHDIGDYLSREDKLKKIEAFADINGITTSMGWTTIVPNEHGDWLKQRDESLVEMMILGDKKTNAPKIFESFSNGVKTNRDVWLFNYSKTKATENANTMAKFFNGEVKRYKKATENNSINIDEFISVDRTKISWADDLKSNLKRGKLLVVQEHRLTQSLYRPFSKQWLYADRTFLWSMYQMPSIFPHADSENLVIGVSASESRSAFSVLMTDRIPSLHAADMVGSQYFPLYLYDEAENDGEQKGLFDTGKPEVKRGRKSAITDEALTKFQSAYPLEKLTKEDIFYYVYGILHSPAYRLLFEDNLGKELPRIPCVSTAKDFWHLSKAGRELAELHVNYDKAAPYPVNVSGKSLAPSDYRVEKMKVGKSGKTKDLTTLIYNSKITLTDIPAEAYEYVVNGKPALDWVIERQTVKADKDSGIVNDANEWATETLGDPKYPLELFRRVITVSLETMKIIKALPSLDIAPVQDTSASSE